MSNSTIGWVHLDATRWALAQMSRSDITPLAKLVLLAMASHVREDRFEVWPSQDRLAELVGATRQGVRLAIDSLEAAGLVVVTKAEGGMRAPHSYSLPRCKDYSQRCKVAAETDVNSVDTKEVQPEVQSTSTKRARGEQPDLIPDPVILRFPTVGVGRGDWPLTESLVQEFRDLFPGVDVLAECRKALAWIKARPEKRKTASGMRKFLTGWLTRATDAPKPNGHGYLNGRKTESLQARIDRSRHPDEDNLAEALRISAEQDAEWFRTHGGQS